MNFIKFLGITSRLSGTKSASFLAILLGACGKKASQDTDNTVLGFSSSYVAPKSDYNQPDATDPNFKVLEPTFVRPYWVNSLEMDNGKSIVSEVLSLNDRTVFFSFPSELPSYFPVSVLGWAPANEPIMQASVEIFEKLEEILNVRFLENDENDNLNTISISQSIQANSAGLSYFPNLSFALGSDIFMSKDYSNPRFFSNGLTNYDYEVLLHEIGHALGLKHPFEDHNYNNVILNSYEDQTKFTAMSYNDSSSTFDGTFRVLDWMALTKFYGVNPLYNEGNNNYKFSVYDAIFIIDGNGKDTIKADDLFYDTYVDLRPGSHSYVMQKSSYITSNYQLTISHDSWIENVETGSGNDTIVGNELSNVISSAAGNDVIFSGEGADVVNSGSGKDSVDFSEDINVEDILVIDFKDSGQKFDTVYGFNQGPNGDVIQITNFGFGYLNFLPTVDTLNVPVGVIDESVIRVFGQDIRFSEDLARNLSSGGLLEQLQLSENNSAIFVTATSKETGEDQNVFVATNNAGLLEVVQLVELFGNYLDIDNWTAENFVVT